MADLETTQIIIGRTGHGFDDPPHRLLLHGAVHTFVDIHHRHWVFRSGAAYGLCRRNGVLFTDVIGIAWLVVFWKTLAERPRIAPHALVCLVESTGLYRFFHEEKIQLESNRPQTKLILHNLIRGLMMAGTPTAMLSSGTSFNTTALAPMDTRLPMRMAPSNLAPVPMST